MNWLINMALLSTFASSSASLAEGARSGFAKNLRHPEEPSVFSMSREGRKPDVLIFACSDSRVEPQAIFQTQPGQIYHFRVPGNIVSPGPETAPSSTAGVDHILASAIDDMGVDVIAVVGHTECSCIESLVDTGVQPSVWAQLATPVIDRVAKRYGHLSEEHRRTAAVAENVRAQREYLLSRSDVQAALADKKLKSVEAYVYELGEAHRGALSQWNDSTKSFDVVAGRTTGIVKPMF